MFDQVIAAFDRKDYRTAARLVKELLQTSPKDPWVQFYVGRLHEVSGKLDLAEKIYRQLLREVTNPKLAAQTRQGIQRLETLMQERRKQAIAQAANAPDSHEPGFLILESAKPEAKAAIAQGLAKVTKLDAYTARLQIPSRGWRLYRSSNMGELQVYTQELQDAGVPVFNVSLADIQKIQVFRVQYFQAIEPQAHVVCYNEADQLGTISFRWAEVNQRVEGLLPIFEQVVDLDVRNRLQRKEQTQDYARFCDLHLFSRGCILRFYDGAYQFNQGVDFSSAEVAQKDVTTRGYWNRLIEFLTMQLPKVPIWSDFTPFAETAIDQTENLQRLKPHINLFRQVASDWDPAFQLYSSAIFLKNRTS
ncbi:MAG: tetratricopeptide repeat protein [Scytolyngbya sp. HA4215-MV1]|jgi:tetratricopeptide (TPR) repeat protein|nr:tetratricopeptide repeat protein [Scytolyngbya sp. HA4215-MV1]